MKARLSIVKRLLASNKISFIVTAVVVLCATTSGDSAVALSNGNYTWLLAVLTPFFFVFYDFKKLIHLGASKKDFYFGALVSYVGLAFLVSLLNTGIHLLIDPLNHTQTVINLMAVCGWMENNVFFAFVQQAVFLLLSMVFLHVLLSMQPHWYGWLTDIILVAIICIFTPIAPLRGLLAGFFKVIMFNPNALAHISICIGVSAALSAVGLTVLKQKTL